MEKFNIDTLDAFTRAYMECALWSSTYSDNNGNDDIPMDAMHDITDISPETRAAMIADCAKFQADNAALLKEAYTTPREGEQPTIGYYSDNAGHDFWLTRCGHGVGFWDRGLGECGEKLTALCGYGTQYPNIDLYIGDDGKVWA